MTRTLNQYEWMLLNGDKLADVIKETGRMDSEEADALLTEAQQLDSSGRVREQARKLLKSKLEYRGVGHLLEL